MRRVLCAAAVCGAVVLSGCVALTDDASNVTQTSARLNGHGWTDDAPAHYYFRYANHGNDLGTDVAKRTPRRDVPAHVGSADKPVPFHEDVTGLSPGRVYVFEVCGGDDPSAPERCGGRRSFFTDPSSTQDTIDGFVSEPGSTSLFPPMYTFDVASGPSGEDPDGFVTVTQKNFGWFKGRVSCLKITAGPSAAVGAIGTAYYGWPDAADFDAPPRPLGLLFTLTQVPFQDRTVAFRQQFPPDCEGASFANQAPTGGTLVITDRP